MGEHPLSQTEALTRLARLNRRQQQRSAETRTLEEIKDVLRQAARNPNINRSALINHSGLSRRTVYEVLDEPS